MRNHSRTKKGCGVHEQKNNAFPPRHPHLISPRSFSFNFRHGLTAHRSNFPFSFIALTTHHKDYSPPLQKSPLEHICDIPTRLSLDALVWIYGHRGLDQSHMGLDSSSFFLCLFTFSSDLFLYRTSMSCSFFS